MAIDASAWALGGLSVSLGECIYLPDTDSPLLVLDNKTYLKSGSISSDDVATYPAAYTQFAMNKPLSVRDWVVSDIPLKIDYIATSGSLYLGATWGNSNVLATSLDGFYWTPTTGPFDVTSQICFFNGYFYIIGKMNSEVTGVSYPRIYRTATPDVSSSWVVVCSGVVGSGESDFLEINATSTILVAVSGYFAGANTNNYVTSPDGVTWTRRSSSLMLIPKTLGVVNNTFVLFGINGTTSANVALFSLTGTTWTSWTAAVTALTATTRFNVEVAYSSTLALYVAVDAYGAIYTFTGIAASTAWTKRLDLASSSLGFYGVAWDGANFVAVGQGGIYYSPNGIDWIKATETPSGTSWLNTFLGQYIYGNGKIAQRKPSNYIGLPLYVEEDGQPLYMRIK